MRKFLYVCALILPLAACGGHVEYGDVEGLRFLSLQKVDGRTYEVGRIDRASNHFYVRSRDGESASRRQMIRAVRLTYRCESHRVLQVGEKSASMQVQGLFCPDTGGIRSKGNGDR